jgi:hypothetical protein
MVKRITPEKITELQKSEIFVFGSNESGFHGAGAAYCAFTLFGHDYRLGFGRSGNCFAIPTKDWQIKTLPLEDIKFYINRFLDYVKFHKELIFYVTPIGCGLAGYTPEQIAPLFKDFISLKNVYLPESFWKKLL